MASPEWPARPSPPIDPQLGTMTIYSPELSKEPGTKMQQTSWQEPPLRAPQPSFMDHGGDRVGVLEGMMPLGTHPSARVKAKAKADPLRRAMHARTFEGVALDDLRSTPDPVNTGENTRATSILPEEQSGPQTPVTEEPRTQQQPFSAPAAAPNPEFTTTQNISPLRPPSPTPAQPPSTSFSFPSTPAAFPPPPPSNFMGQPFPAHQSSMMASLPLHRFDYGIRNSLLLRPDLHGVIDAIHSAANKDPEFRTLLATQALKHGSTTEQNKALKKKVRRFKKAWHHGQAAIQNSTFGALELQPAASPQQHSQPHASNHQSINSATISKTALPSNSVQTMDMADQPPFADAHQKSLTPPPKPPNSGIPTLKLRLTQTRPSPTSPQVSQSFHLEPSRSPLRNMSNLSEPEAFGPALPKPARHTPGKHDSDLSSVDEDITNQDQSTFLQMARAAPRTRGQTRKRQYEPEVDEQGSNKRIAVDNTVDEVKEKRARYDTNVITEAHSQYSSVRPSVKRPLSQSPDGDQVNITSHSQHQFSQENGDLSPQSPDNRKLRAPLAHLDPTGSPTDLESRQIPTALGRPKKIKTPKVKIPSARTGEDKLRRTVLAGKPELHDNNRPRDASGRPTSSSGSSENSDYCAACGGDGYLLCCDGEDCKRSFHFNCVFPPISDKAALGESWYCDDCHAKQRRSERVEDTIWHSLFSSMDKKNPAAFSLPATLRERYPNVTTTANGEYYESTVPERVAGRRGNASNVSGDPPYDYFRTHDVNNGRRLVCHRCGEGARHPDKAIVACDYCDKAWHLDCFFPPRAHHPHRYTSDNKHRHAWMCPLHVAHDLAHIDAVDMDGGVRAEVPTHKLRTPKSAQVVRSAQRRGVPNNGDIDITFVEDELSERHARRQQRWQEDSAVRYQLSDEEVVLDFIHKVKSEYVHKSRGEYIRAVEALREKTEKEVEIADLKLQNAKALEAKLTEHAPRDQQAALRLVQMATGLALSDVGAGSRVNELVKTLLAEAPEGGVDDGVNGQRAKPELVELDDAEYDELMQAHKKMTAVLDRERAKRKRVSKPTQKALGR